MGLKLEIQTLIESLTDDKISVSKGITKAKTLNSKLKNRKISNFVQGEVYEKYDDDTLPEYRLIWGEPTFEFQNSYNGLTDIRTIPLPEGTHFSGKSTNFRPILNNVNEIENIIEKNKGETFKIQFTPGQFEIASPYVNHLIQQTGNWQLLRAWWSHSPTSFPGMLFKIKQALIDILLEIEHSILEKDFDEKIFSEKSQFDASFEVLKLIEKAKNTIVLIDSYIDGNTLKLLSSKKESVSIRLLTDPKANSEALEVLIEKFNKQYKNLEIKYSKSFHDRFMIIDELNFYQIGASMKDLGNKTFTFVKLKETFMTDALMTNFNKEWNKK